MALLLLDRSQLEIKSEGETLVIYEAGQRQGTIPIKLIDRCIIHGSNTRLDSGTLIKLAQAGASTVIMSPRNHERVALVLGPQHNDAAIRIAQTRRVMDAQACGQWARSLVIAKLKRQHRTLTYWLVQRPVARKPLLDALRSLDTIQHNLGEAFASNEAEPWSSLNSLRGSEGSAARAYFAGFASVLPPVLAFTGRNRRPPRDPVNACLSLGYTLLHSQAIQACVQAGLDPLIGFYHRPAFGRESLASDLIEPLRPVVDLWIWDLLRERHLREEHFSIDKGRCLLGKAGRGIFYTSWEKSHAKLRRWLRQQSQHLARQLRVSGLAWVMEHGEDEEA